MLNLQLKIQKTNLDINDATTTKTGRKSLLYHSTEIWKEKRHIFNGDYVGWRESGYHVSNYRISLFKQVKHFYMHGNYKSYNISFKLSKCFDFTGDYKFIMRWLVSGKAVGIGSVFHPVVALASFFPLGCLL